MIHKYLRIHVSVRATIPMLFLVLKVNQLHAQQEYCSSRMDNVGNGYHYEMWVSDGTRGTACMTVYGKDATFKTVWDLSSYGFVARVGLKFDSKKTIEQIGWITSDYEFTKTGNGQAYMGIYGWTLDTLYEYYIIEDWNVWRPSFTHKGTITVDGGEYDVYTNTQIEKPSIVGTRTFDQWYSVRKKARQSGQISISQHFTAWMALGMRAGKLYEAKLKVEGMNGSGTVDFTKATVVIGTRPDTIPVPVFPNTPKRQISSPGNSILRKEWPVVLLNGKLLRSIQQESLCPGSMSNGMYIIRLNNENKTAANGNLLIK